MCEFAKRRGLGERRKGCQSPQESSAAPGTAGQAASGPAPHGSARQTPSAARAGSPPRASGPRSATGRPSSAP